MSMSMKSLGRLRGVGWNACVGGGGYARCFSMGSRRETDGVYRELTAMRTRVPFIEAWRKEEAKRKGKEGEMEKEKGGEMQKVVKGGEGEGLEMKRMKDSFHRVILPLASDPWLLDNYITASGHIRLGAIFMDLDALAGVISYKHTGDRVMTVTAAVDRITLSRPLLEICDLELSGQVTFATGRSSMEVSLQVCKVPSAGQENLPRRKEDVFMECAFTMVSLDPVTKKAVRIAGVRPEGEVEEAWFERGRKSYDKKKRELGRGLRSMEPDDEESDLIHRLWLKTLDYHDPNTPSLLPKTCTRMSNSTIQSVQIMQPQYRNRHNFMIFGGFLLKSTFELAFTCASAISHSRPIFLALDPSTFENPVPVGSVLYVSATLAYGDRPLVRGEGDADAETETEMETGTERNRNESEEKKARGKKTRVQIRVDTKVKNVEHGETKPTGQFNYTFEVEGEVQVLPESYREFMVYLDARRRSRGRGGLAEVVRAGNAEGGVGKGVLGAGGDGGLKVL